MDEKMIIEEMARLDGYKKFKKPKIFDYGWAWGIHNGGLIRIDDLPDYLTDHNAVQRVIDGLDDFRFMAYGLCLQDVVEQFVQGYAMLKATCPHKCEAILKATGKWED